MRTGRHYGEAELQTIGAAIKRAKDEETPLEGVFNKLAVDLERSANAIETIARDRGFLPVTKGGRQTHYLGVDDTQAIDTSCEKAHRVACQAADAVFQERMRIAVVRGNEQVRFGVRKAPCTASPRQLRADPLIYIRSSSDFAGVDLAEV